MLEFIFRSLVTFVTCILFIATKIFMNICDHAKKVFHWGNVLKECCFRMSCYVKNKTKKSASNNKLDIIDNDTGESWTRKAPSNHSQTLSVYVLRDYPMNAEFVDRNRRRDSFSPVLQALRASNVSNGTLASEGFYCRDNGYIRCYWCSFEVPVNMVTKRQHAPGCGHVFHNQPPNHI
ncbi:unnamed protein product [Candidula unifasciata]|uniref:Uncharacterized protein n=1 Tax=Candidula unifasciata TaxID=100452 RepID=A0A8S3ZUM8_9EUPU|nr:unnamed protein product [Candidula unifasciata]